MMIEIGNLPVSRDDCNFLLEILTNVKERIEEDEGFVSRKNEPSRKAALRRCKKIIGRLIAAKL